MKAEAPIWIVAALITAFTVKHFIADFVLQTNWIARGKDCPERWLAPLATHVGIHAALALVIVLAVAPRLWWLALVDFAIHWTVDRTKTLTGRWVCCTPQQPSYWWLFGFDQLLHQLTNIGLAVALIVLS